MGYGDILRAQRGTKQWHLDHDVKIGCDETQVAISFWKHRLEAGRHTRGRERKWEVNIITWKRIEMEFYCGNGNGNGVGGRFKTDQGATTL